MFLHPDCFRKTSTLSEALGLAPEFLRFHEKSTVFDVSSSVRQVNGNSEDFKFGRAVPVMDGNYLDPLDAVGHPGTGVSPEGEETLLHSEDSEPSDYPTRVALNAMLLRFMDREHGANIDNSDHSSEGSVSRQSAAADEDGSPRDPDGAEHAHADDEEDDVDDEDDYDDEDEDIDEAEDSNVEDDDAFEEPQTSTLPTTGRVKNYGMMCRDLPCPIMQASVASIYLMQPVLKQWDRHSPIITLHEPFQQQILHIFSQIDDYERCNMHAQIPSLGIVVLATQKGRVAILSLTQCTAELRDYGARSGVSYKRVFGFRLDHILPFATQEAAFHRPSAPLHGIAVGPLQGSERAPNEMKRWRLMVMYQDHTVLSYEIGRPKGDYLGSDRANVVMI